MPVLYGGSAVPKGCNVSTSRHNRDLCILCYCSELFLHGDTGLCGLRMECNFPT